MNFLTGFLNKSAFGAMLMATLTVGCVTNAQEMEPTAGVIFSGAGEENRPAIVLAHDWFGNSPYYRDFAKRLVDEGFTVIASDLYEGKPGAKTHAEAWDLLKNLTEAHAAEILDANIKLASQHSDKVIAIGFSAGVPHALEAAIRNTQTVDAAVSFYGDPITDQEKLSHLGGPVLAIYGSKDPLYGELRAADVAAQFSKSADEAGASVEIHIYAGADHAFAQPLYNAGTTYDATAAESAWQIAMDFISRIEAGN